MLGMEMMNGVKVSNKMLGTFALIIVYWIYSGISVLLGSLDDYRLHTRKDEDEKNLVSKNDVVKGVLLQQAVQAVVATLLFVNKRNPGTTKPRLFTISRLDVNTTGLIIVANDGEFANKVSYPSSNLSKEYIATISGAVSKRQLFAIGEGTIVEGVHCIPNLVELLPQQPDISRA